MRVCVYVSVCISVCLYVRGLNGDVRLHSGRSGSVEMEMYRGADCQRSLLTAEKNQLRLRCLSLNDHWLCTLQHAHMYILQTALPSVFPSFVFLFVSFLSLPFFLFHKLLVSYIIA